MKNKIQNGKVIDYTNGGGAAIASGALVVIGVLAGVAVSNIAVGESGAVDLQGVFELPKVTGTAIAVGDKVYWDATAGNVTKTASGNTAFGAAVEAAVSAATTVKVLLVQGS